jgi:sulfur carrier protein
MKTTTIIANGKPTELPADVRTVAGYLDHAGLAGKRIAVERNGEIVPRSRYAEASLADGDRLEIVGAVGGG